MFARQPAIVWPGSHRITLGGVEEIPPPVDGPPHDREAGSLVTLLTEGHRAQTNFRHLETCASHAFDFHHDLPESAVSRGHAQERNCIIEPNDLRTRATPRSE